MPHPAGAEEKTAQLQCHACLGWTETGIEDSPNRERAPAPTCRHQIHRQQFPPPPRLHGRPGQRGQRQLLRATDAGELYDRAATRRPPRVVRPDDGVTRGRRRDVLPPTESLPLPLASTAGRRRNAILPQQSTSANTNSHQQPHAPSSSPATTAGQRKRRQQLKSSNSSSLIEGDGRDFAPRRMESRDEDQGHQQPPDLAQIERARPRHDARTRHKAERRHKAKKRKRNLQIYS